MDKGKTTCSSAKSKQDKDAALKGDTQAATADELHQVAGADHPALTTNQGIVISDNQNSLKANPRGPALLEDFILREKLRISITSVFRSVSFTREERACMGSSS